MKVTTYRYHFWKALLAFVVIGLTLFVALLLLIAVTNTDDTWLINLFFGGIIPITAFSYHAARRLCSVRVQLFEQDGVLFITKIKNGIPVNEISSIQLKEIKAVHPKYGRDKLHTLIIVLEDSTRLVFRNSAGSGSPEMPLEPLSSILLVPGDGTALTTYNAVGLSKFRPEQHMGQFDFFSPAATPQTDKYLICKARIFPLWLQMIFYTIAFAVITICIIAYVEVIGNAKNILAMAIFTTYAWGVVYYFYWLINQPVDLLIYEDKIIIRKQKRYFWQPDGKKTIYFKDVVRFVVTWPEGSKCKKIKFEERNGRTSYIREYRHLSARTKTEPYFAEAYISKTLHRFIELYQVNIKREYWAMDYSGDNAD
jgi:hypothetical protein